MITNCLESQIFDVFCPPKTGWGQFFFEKHISFYMKPFSLDDGRNNIFDKITYNCGKKQTHFSYFLRFLTWLLILSNPLAKL